MANIIFSEDSGVNDSIFGKSQAPIRQFIEKRGEAFEQESVAKALFKTEKSTHFGEKFTSLTAMDGFQVTGENGAYPTEASEARRLRSAARIPRPCAKLSMASSSPRFCREARRRPICPSRRASARAA